MFQMKKVISVLIFFMLSIFCMGTVAFADDGGSTGITIEVNGSYNETTNTIGQGILYTGTSLQDAKNKVSDDINQLKVTGGSFTTDDWKYLINIDTLENFEIDGAVTNVADMPHLYDNVNNIDRGLHLFPYSIKSVNIPQEIIIGRKAFDNCVNLKHVSFPEVTTISDEAFGSCYSLTTVEFPKVTAIGECAFMFCGLEQATSTEFSEVTSIGEKAFFNCINLVNVEFPIVTDIGAGAFQECHSLTTVEFPKVTTISDAAFRGCYGLTTVKFPKATTIGDMAFWDCDSLKQASLTEFPQVTSIAVQAFEDCSFLTTAEFPKVTDIGAGAFNECTSLTNLKLGTIPPAIDVDTFLNTPKTNNLVLMDIHGTELSGNSLIEAKKRYTDVDDSSVIGQQAGDNFWYGWKIEDIATPSTKYTVTVENGTGGGQYAENDTVTVKANTAPSGEVFDKWIVNSGTVTLANTNSATTSFAMPKENVRITAIFKDESSGGSSGGSSSRGGGSNKRYYNIKASANFGGAISPSGTVRVREDRDEKFTIIANSGYDISDVLVDGKSVGSVAEYEFEDVSKNHTIEVSFERIEPLFQASYYKYNPFIDVQERNWFYNTVLTTYEKGLMTGTAHNVFSPNLETSRAMIINILYRLERQPFCYLNSRFNDVSNDKWYAYAIAWGNKNNIIAGYGDRTFKPNQPITREELATIFYKYAKYKGYNISTYGMSLDFRDINKVSTWSMNSVKWAVGNNIISGKGYGILDPGNFATRAETATMIMNFTEFSAKFQ